MKKNNSLDYAIEQMKLGSRKGFLNFYRGTVSYVYSSAYLLYNDRDEALRFMEDLYLYMYLHITDYKGDGDVKKWVSRELLDRYRQLMIGRELTDVGALQAMQESVELDKDGRKMLETALLSNISFPPQKGSISATWLLIIVLFVSGVILLAYLIAGNVKPKASIDADILTENAKKEDVSSNNVSNGNGKDSGLKTLSEAQSELEQYLEVYGEPEDTDDTSVTDVIHSEATDGATERIEKSSPDTPEAPKVEEPTVTAPSAETPKTPSASGSKDKGGKDSSTKPEDEAADKVQEFLDEVEEFESYTIGR